MNMKITVQTHTISALVWKEDNWYVAKGLEVEVASQGRTKKEAVQNLQEALELYFEDTPKDVLKSIMSLSDISVEHLPIAHA